MSGAGGSTARTGRNGKVVIGGALMARATTWSINASVGETAWGDSGSEGYTNRKETRYDATGTIEGKFDEVSKVYGLAPSTGHLQGYVTSLVLWETTEAKTYWNFPCALIQTYQQQVNMDTQEVVGFSMTYGSDGKFWRPGQSGAPTVSLPT
jgi:hypothetical protein